MAMDTGYNKPAEYPRPLPDRASEHDSPHGADMDQSYAHQTNGVIWRMAGATRSWVWPFIRRPLTTWAAPLAEITAAQTWTGFSAGSQSIELPWRFTESYERILIYTGLVCNADIALKVRWDSAALVDAVAGATGDAAASTPRATQPLEMVTWRQFGGPSLEIYGQNTWFTWLTPTVPANRRIKLVPYVQARDIDPRFDVSGKVYVWMISAVVMDIPPKDDVGW